MGEDSECQNKETSQCADTCSSAGVSDNSLDWHGGQETRLKWLMTWQG